MQNMYNTIVKKLLQVYNFTNAINVYNGNEPNAECHYLRMHNVKCRSVVIVHKTIPFHELKRKQIMLEAKTPSFIKKIIIKIMITTHSSLNTYKRAENLLKSRSH